MAAAGTAPVDDRGGAGSTDTCILHPLVLMDICDHFTRIKMQNPAGGEMPRVYGVLFGTQTGLSIEMFHSTEIIHEEKDGSVKVDVAFIRERLALLREVFPSYELLGWYSTATEVESSDMDIHQTIMEFNESPVYVRLDPAVKPEQKDLPVFAYQAEFHAKDTAGGAAATVFVRMPLRIDAVESERITVDAISDSRREDDSRSGLVQHIDRSVSALTRLSERVAVLQQFLHRVDRGEVEASPEILRRIAGLCNRLPAEDSKEFTREFLADLNDASILSLVAAVTKGTEALADTLSRSAQVESTKRFSWR